MKKTTFAQRLRFLIDDAGITQTELARKAGVSKSSISRYLKGDWEAKQDIVYAIAHSMGVNEAWLMGYDVPMKQLSSTIPSNAIPYECPTGMVPVLGSIPAGTPVIADGCIEGYEPIDRPHPDEYYWLRVQGDSMVNARIFSGDLVLIHMQNYAENGQIVACRVNGDEATLKRYREQDDCVMLIPENPDYEPRIVSKQDFAVGYAAVMGVVVESKRKF